MSTRVQRRRGTTSEHNSFVGALGETTVDTDKKTVVVHDGITPGGFPLARADANFVNKSDAGLLSGFRNKLMNPRMDIRQRSNGVTVAAGGSQVIVCDRWIVANNTDASCVVNHVVAGLGNVSGDGALIEGHLSIIFASAPTSGELFVYQPIENVQTVQPGKEYTLVANVFASAGAPAVRGWCEQHFGSGGSVSPKEDILDVIPSSNIANNWSKISGKKAIPSVSGKIRGASLPEGWFNVIYAFSPRAAGTLAITNCAFVEGDALAEDDPVGRISYAEELARCKRYYRKSYRQSLTAGESCDLQDCVGVASRAGASSSGYVEGLVKFDTEMRRAPTIVTYDRNGVSGKAVLAAGGGYVDNSAVTIDRYSDAGFRFFSDNTTTKDGLIFAYTADADYI